jgi:hypothetical protein
MHLLMCVSLPCVCPYFDPYPDPDPDPDPYPDKTERHKALTRLRSSNSTFVQNEYSGEIRRPAS